MKYKVVSYVYMNNRMFSRNLGLITASEQEKLLQSKVAIAGTGTDGGLLAERLIRAGVGALNLADPEIFEGVNLNRQYGCDTTTLGQNKAEVVGQLIRQINPQAEIAIFNQGITETNVAEFVADADIVVDEIEYFNLDISILLHREARRQGKPVYLGVNVGWGANLFIFSPQGMTLEEYVDLPKETTLENAKSYVVPPEKFSPALPPYWDAEFLDKIIHEDVPVPSVSPAAGLIASLLSASIILKLAKNKEYGIVPKYTSIDFYTGKATF